MSDEPNGFLLQTLQNLNASIAALNARLDKMDEEDAVQKADIAVLKDRTDRNAIGMATSLVGTVFLGFLKVLDFFSAK